MGAQPVLNVKYFTYFSPIGLPITEYDRFYLVLCILIMVVAKGCKDAVNFWLNQISLWLLLKLIIISIFDTGMNTSLNMLINSSALSQFCKRTFENVVRKTW